MTAQDHLLPPNPNLPNVITNFYQAITYRTHHNHQLERPAPSIQLAAFRETLLYTRHPFPTSFSRLIPLQYSGKNGFPIV